MEMEMGRNTLSLLDVPGEVLRWMNLSGRETEYNPKGRRNFEVELPEDYAQALFEDGWRIKKRGNIPGTKEYKNFDFDDDVELDDVTYKIKIVCNFDSIKPPTVYRLVDGQKKLQPLSVDGIGDKNIGIIDKDYILSVDMDLNGYVATKGKKDGKKSIYLENAVFTVRGSATRNKYAEFEIADEDVGEVPWAKE